MNTTRASRVTALTDAYEAAGATIDGFEDRVERDLGLGSLRGDATRALAKLQSSAAADPDELATLADFVAGARGGGASEWTIKGIEKARGEVIQEVFESLRETIAAGTAAGVFSVLIAIGLFVVDSGAAFAVSLVTLGGGALWYFARGVDAALRGAQRALIDSWTWASALGKQAELAMKGPREAEQELFRALRTVPPTRVDSLTGRARSVARSVVGATWAALIVAAALFAYGMARGIDKLTETPSLTSGQLIFL